MFRRPAFLGLIAVIAAWTWMLLLVHYNYGGNWTALYLIGPRTPVPASIASERLYIFPNNSGYDGQSFHVIAHDPWMLRSTPAEVEIEPFRYARILVPAVAWALALGRDRWIDPAYFAVILSFVFLGVYWTGRYAARVSIHPAWGLTFLLSPATLTSIDRMTVDVALAALCAAFVFYADRVTPVGEQLSHESLWKVIIVLMCALLTRETAVILFGCYEAVLLLRRRFADAFFTLLAGVPLAAWHVYIASRTGYFVRRPRLLGWIPLEGWFHRLTHPSSYDLTGGVASIAIALDYAALIGMVLAVAFAARVFVLDVSARKSTVACEPTMAHAFAIVGFALAVVFLRGQGEWGDAFAFGRIFAPLLLLLAMYGMPRRRPSRIWLGFAPTLLVDSRIALNFGRHAQQLIQGWLHWA